MTKRFRRRIWVQFQRALGRDQPPWEVALSFAVGVGISFSPLLGFHTLIALVVAWVFRLNKVDTLIGTMIFVNPWTMVPIYSAATGLGWVLLGHSSTSLPEIPWRELASISYWKTFGLTPWKPYLASFFLGSSVFMIVAGLTTYGLSVSAIKRSRARRAERARRRAARTEAKAAQPDEPT